MSNFSENISLIEKGGFLMYPIVLLSLYTITVIVYKAYQFYSSKALRSDFANDAIVAIKEADIAKSEKILRNNPSPLARVMQTALKLMRYDDLPPNRVEPEIERIGMNEIKKLESNLRGLEIVSGVAPLIGLLGTVIGMVKAFARLADSSSRIDPSVLAGGIWEALITTIGGLMVAIPAFAAYYIFDGLIDRLRLNMKDSATQILNLEKEIKNPVGAAMESAKARTEVKNEAAKPEAAASPEVAKTEPSKGEW